MDLAQARKSWFLHGTVGVLLMGSGLAVLFDAAFRRLKEVVAEIWIVEGTLGFILTMAGFAFFGSAIRYMVHMDRIVEYTDRKARRKKRHRSESASRGLRLETDDAVTTTRMRQERSAAGVS